MGCIQGTSRTQSPPRYHEDAGQSPYVGHQPDSGTRHIIQNLRSVLNQTNELTNQIGHARSDTGEHLRSVHEAAISLRNRIQNKLRGNVLRGSGADDYRQELNQIRQDFNAISSVGIDESRYFEHSVVFERAESPR